MYITGYTTKKDEQPKNIPIDLARIPLHWERTTKRGWADIYIKSLYFATPKPRVGS